MPISKNQNVKSSISKHIKNYLNKNPKVSKSEFGKLFNVSHTTVNRWINELCVPELELFPAICDLLNITIYEFIGVEDPNKLTKVEFEIIESYHNNENFRVLIDRYRSDSKFRNDIDKMINQ